MAVAQKITGISGRRYRRSCDKIDAISSKRRSDYCGKRRSKTSIFEKDHNWLLPRGARSGGEIEQHCDQDRRDIGCAREAVCGSERGCTIAKRALCPRAADHTRQCAVIEDVSFYQTLHIECVIGR